MQEQEYEIIRSARKTMAIYVRPDGRVEVRAPQKTSAAQIRRFVSEKSPWIRQAQETLRKREAEREVTVLTAEEERFWREKARTYLEMRCAYFAKQMGVSYEKIKINGARTRWGSCSSRGIINFTWRLMFVPEELIDYVVVHELAHRKEMNHSERFWKAVEQIMPDYRQRRASLKAFSRTAAVESENDVT